MAKGTKTAPAAARQVDEPETPAAVPVTEQIKMTPIAALRAEARELVRTNAGKPVNVDGRASADFVLVIGIALLRATVAFLRMEAARDGLPSARNGGEASTLTGASRAAALLGTSSDDTAQAPVEEPQAASNGKREPPPEVMTADEVATFFGVDRNTVYDYAGRGVIPHQRLGKRMLFHRGALVSWLDASCKAASARKG